MEAGGPGAGFGDVQSESYSHMTMVNPTPGGTFDKLISGPAGYALLALLALAFFLPGLFSIPPIDRDEARYAQATKQMLDDGDFVRIKIQDEPRHKKPIGIYWMQAVSVGLSGARDSIWAYRIPSMLGALLAVLLTFYFGRRWQETSSAFLGAGLLASCALISFVDHMATPEGMLLACSVAAQGALGQIYVTGRYGGQRPARKWAALFWLALSVGILLKGPALPLICGATILALCIWEKRIGWIWDLRPISGLAMLIVIVAPWMIAIGIATKGTFFTQAFGEDILPKLVGGQESHGAPPGLYLALAFATFWPGSLFMGQALAQGWRDRFEPAVRFLLCWLIPGWLVFEIIPTKLPHYVLPMYPALALLCGRIVQRSGEISLKVRGFDLTKAFWLIWCGVLGGVALFIPVLPYIIERRLDWLSLSGTAIGLAMLYYAFRRFRAGRPDQVILPAILCGALVLGMLFQFTLPGMSQLWTSQAAKEMVLAAQPGRVRVQKPVAAVGYAEASLVFALGTETKLVGPEKAAELLATGESDLVLIDEKEAPCFLKELENRKQKADLVNKARTMNYTKGKWLVLRLYKAVRKG